MVELDSDCLTSKSVLNCYTIVSLESSEVFKEQIMKGLLKGLECGGSEEALERFEPQADTLPATRRVPRAQGHWCR